MWDSQSRRGAYDLVYEGIWLGMGETVDFTRMDGRIQVEEVHEAVDSFNLTLIL